MIGVGRQRAHIGQAQTLGERIAIRQRLPKQLAGVHEQDRRVGFGLRDQMQDYRALRPERRHHTGFAGIDVRQHAAHRAGGVQPVKGRVQRLRASFQRQPVF